MRVSSATRILLHHIKILLFFLHHVQEEKFVFITGTIIQIFPLSLKRRILHY